MAFSISIKPGNNNYTSIKVKRDTTAMNSMSFLILLFLSSASLLSHQAIARRHGFSKKDGASSTPGLCTAATVLRTYKCEELEVTTEDGYIINIAKISGGQAGGGLTSRQPVLMQHGLLVDGMTWLLNPPELNLATILVDNGFDVYISNNRGTRFSQRHTSMNINNPEYWNWSWDDLVEKDMPSMIGFVSQETGQKVHYIGHSQGTLVALAAFAEGKLVDNLKSAVLLSPIAYLSHLATSPAQFINPQMPPGSTPNVPAAFMSGENCCVSPMAYGLFGMNEPQPSSSKNLEHYEQTATSGKVTKFDYGLGNMASYGQPTPPIYDMTKIPHNLPLFLTYGGRDTLSVVADVETLLRDLQGHDQDKLKTQLVPEYGHGDFIMAANAKDIVYNQVLDFFKQFP